MNISKSVVLVCICAFALVQQIQARILHVDNNLVVYENNYKVYIWTFPLHREKILSDISNALNHSDISKNEYNFLLNNQIPIDDIFNTDEALNNNLVSDDKYKKYKKLFNKSVYKMKVIAFKKDIPIELAKKIGMITDRQANDFDRMGIRFIRTKKFFKNKSKRNVKKNNYMLVFSSDEVLKKSQEAFQNGNITEEEYNEVVNSMFSTVAVYSLDDALRNNIITPTLYNDTLLQFGPATLIRQNITTGSITVSTAEKIGEITHDVAEELRNENYLSLGTSSGVTEIIPPQNFTTTANTTSTSTTTTPSISNTTTTTEPSTTTGGHKECQKGDRLIPDRRDCTYYYDCSVCLAHPERKRCPLDSYFNKIYNVCEKGPIPKICYL